MGLVEFIQQQPLLAGLVAVCVVIVLKALDGGRWT